MIKSLSVHLVLLAVASGLALSVWTDDAEQDKTSSAEVEVWSGSPDSVEGVWLETKQRKVRLEPKRDEAGRYYVVRVDKEEPAPTPPPAAGGQAGAPPPAPAPKTQKLAFVGVKAAGELVAKLAKLSAVRALGKLPAARAGEFGLDQPEGTLKLAVGGKQHLLTIGGPTPGSNERYARYGASGEVFAISGDILQSLQYADSRLMERELHAFEDDEVTRIKLTRGGKTRELVRIEGKQNAWADVATPQKPDESFVNWLTKLERVRITDYVETPAPPGPEQLSVRLEYFVGPKRVGFLELYKRSGEQGTEYLGKSEQTRWFAKVLASAAEQADQDAASLFR